MFTSHPPLARFPFMHKQCVYVGTKLYTRKAGAAEYLYVISRQVERRERAETNTAERHLRAGR